MQTRNNIADFNKGAYGWPVALPGFSVRRTGELLAPFPGSGNNNLKDDENN